ncbi:MAG: hypothetical protein H7144_00080 [Burkholderiales bacterium]|nr:hypothetical protein [Phycisphaerae bacterium]
MKHRTPGIASALIFSVGFLTGGVAKAEQVQLPYQAADNNGNQWIVQYQGQLQQQGNQPAFSQAGMITINGQTPRQQNQQATVDDKTREVIISLMPNNTPIRHQRRFKFDEETGLARVIDVFDNPTDREIQLNLQLMSNTNFGVNSATIMEDPKKKTQLGWMADLGSGRAAMSLWAGKGAKIAPTIRYTPGNNMVQANLALKVPAKDKAALVGWHGSFDNSEAGNTWFQQMREPKLLADLPPDVRKSIVNIAGIASTSISGREVLRGETTDIIELRGGDQMRGDLKIDSYQLATDFGPITLPASKVVCLLNVGDTRPRQLLVTADGEIFGGSLAAQAIPILLSNGQTTQVPLSQIARVGYRTGGAEVPEWQFTQPMVFLRSGERCLIAQPDSPIEFVTRYGAIKIKPQSVAAVVLQTAGNAHDVYLYDGSKISGILANPQWTLALSSSDGSAKVPFALASISRVQFKALAEDIGVGVPTLAMVGGDVVATRLEGKLKLNTPFDTLDLNAAEIRGITRSDEGSSEVVITLFDQSTFRGTLAAPHVTARLIGDLSLEVPVAALREYVNPQPFPSESVVEKAKAQIKLLNADDWKHRESAEAALANMGSPIIGVLESASADQPPEVKQRLDAVLKRLRRDAPASPTRLSPPPPMD